jgi:hypothetical protein
MCDLQAVIKGILKKTKPEGKNKINCDKMLFADRKK